MFGNKAPFGGSSTFQSNTSTFGASKSLGSGFGTPFGSAAPNTSIFSTSTTPGTSIFGASTSNFGQPSTSSTGFGAFSSSSSTVPSLFSTNQTAGSNLFQSPSTSAFGAPKSSFGGFGGTSGTGMFNQNQQTTSLFNQGSTSSSTSLFGSSAGFNTGAFGGGATGPTGTTVKFNAVTGTDTMVKNGVTTNINIRHQCVTIMKEYENKSFEELRIEDYQANRKGPQQGGMGTFGTAQPSLFGSSTTPAVSTGLFQNQNKSIFGTSATPGASTSTVFGQPMQQQQQNTGFLFGGPKPAPFGTAVTTASTFNFGGTTGSSLFGSTATNQNKSLFGTTTSTPGTGLFGASNTLTQTSTGFGTPGFGSAGFGVQNQSGTGLFANKSAFGATTTSAAPSFSFGNQTNTNVSTPFATKPTTAFGTGTGFGSSTSGGFGTTNSLFNQNKPAPAFGNTGSTGFASSLGSLGTGGSSLFAGAVNKPGLGLGTSFSTPLGTGFGGTNSIGLMNAPMISANNVVLGSDQSIAQLAQQQTQAQQQLLALAQSPFGDSPLFRNLLQDTGKREEILKPTNPAAQKALANNSQYKVSPHPAVKVKPKPIHVIANGRASLFDGFDEDDDDMSIQAFVPRKSVKKLELKPKHSLLANKSAESTSTASNGNPDVVKNGIKSVVTPLSRNAIELSIGDTVKQNAFPITPNNSHSPDNYYNNPMSKPLPEHNLNRKNAELDETIAELSNSRNKKRITEGYDSEKENVSQDLSSDGSLDNDSEPEVIQDSELQIQHPARIILRRPNYYTIPSLKELAQCVDSNGDCFVENFTVGREGYGNVYFFGVTNVAGLNLDEIVHFRKKEVTVYPDDDNKPPLNKGLNKRAQVTLDGVWPIDKSTCKPIKNPERLISMRYQEKLEDVSAKLKAKFVDYRPETGSWVFEVPHFSKYGIQDSDDDDVPTGQEANQVQTQTNPLPQQAASQQKLRHRPLGTPQHTDSSGIVQPENDLNKTHYIIAHSFMGDEDEKMEEVEDNEVSSVGFNVEDPEDFPSSRLAMAMDLNSQRIQGMKATLFGDRIDEEEEAMEQDKEFSIGTKKSQKFLASNLSYGMQHNEMLPIVSRQLVHQQFLKTLDPLPVAKTMSLEFIPDPRIHHEPDLSNCIVLPSAPQTATQKIRNVPSSRLRKYIPLSRSRLRNRQHLLADSACLMGKRFRVGWGPGWILANCGVKLPEAETRNTANSSLYMLLEKTNSNLRSGCFSVSLHKIDPDKLTSTQDTECVSNNLERCLEVQLKHSQGALENGSPIMVTSPGVELLHHQSDLLKDLLSNMASNHPDYVILEHAQQVWDLCVALWGHIPGYSEEIEGGNTHAHRMARRKAFSEWLQSVSSPIINNEFGTKIFGEDDHVFSIFSYMTGAQTANACRTALKNSEYRLSTLLSQAASSAEFRDFLKKQLENWQEIKADKFISKIRLKIYALLGGALVWPSSIGEINTCENLDWKRCLAVHLWYSCSAAASIADAVTEYKKAFKGSNPHGKYCPPPLPPHLESKKAIPLVNDNLPVYDVCYHLLRLYMKRSHRLERTLCPSTFTSNSLDHRFSWLLYQSLVSIGFEHLSDYQSNSLHESFASQLESTGLWRWSVFVYLHINQPERRYILINELLARHISLREDPEVEEFLVRKLLIPKTWISYAKACRARYEGKIEDEAWFLLKADRWNESHEIILRHIAPDAIINESYSYLKSFIIELAPVERSKTIRDWNLGGQVYLDYIHISQTIDKIVKGEIGTYELERLQPEVTSLCSRVGNIQCRNAKDRLCQSEMAKKTAYLLRAVLNFQNEDKQISHQLLAPYLNMLPMPEDYAMQELQNLTYNCVSQMTV